MPQTVEPEWLAAHRKAALANFKKSKETLEYGLGIFVNTKEIVFDIAHSNGLSEVELPEVIHEKGIEVSTLNEAFKKNPGFFEKYFSTTPQDKFLAFHNAFFSTGMVIRIPENSSFTPVVINTRFQESRIEFIFVIAEKNSRITIIDKAEGNAGYRSQVVHIVAEQGAEVKYVSTQHCSDTTANILYKEAVVGRNATVTLIDCCFGSGFARSATRTLLQETGAQAKNYGLFFGTGKQVFDISTQTIHQASSTISKMLTKGALSGSAKTIYRGLVRIEPNASKCSGHQKEETLLLSKQAEVDAVPYLEINNNDVKCSHGATVCQPDKEKIFYLMSRGLSEQEAKKSIVQGFFEPVISEVEDDFEVEDDLIANHIRSAIERCASC